MQDARRTAADGPIGGALRHRDEANLPGIRPVLNGLLPLGTPPTSRSPHGSRSNHDSRNELLVVAWSPDGRKVLYAKRRAGRVQPACDFTGCPPPGPSSFFVFDRERRVSVKTEVPGELAAWLPSGDLVVADDDGALARVHDGTKTPVAAGPYRHDDFALDLAGDRLLSTGWNDATKHAEVLALDLRTWQETPIAPSATYLWPHASPSGKRVAWLATPVARRPLTRRSSSTARRSWRRRAISWASPGSTTTPWSRTTPIASTCSTRTTAR